MTELVRWVNDAACRGADPEQFFVDVGGSRYAQQVIDTYCRPCPVRAQCLADAIAQDDWYGIRGGMTERQRVGLRRRAA